MKIAALLLAACLWVLEVSCQIQFIYFNKVFDGYASYIIAQVIQLVASLIGANRSWRQGGGAVA